MTARGRDPVIVRVADGGPRRRHGARGEGRLTRSLAGWRAEPPRRAPPRSGLLAAATLALVAPWLPLLDPDAVDTVERLRQPLTPGHALGTDEFGRDLLARLVWGARVSLLAGVVTAAAAMLIGVTLGIFGGFYTAGSRTCRDRLTTS